MSLTVTATEGTSTANGIMLRLLVLTNVAAGVTGLTGGQTGIHAHEFTGTPTALHSTIYGSLFNGNTAGGFMAGMLSNCTAIDNFGDSGIGQYATFRDANTLSLTSTTYGSAASFNGGLAVAEILAASSAGITEDASAPPLAHTASGHAVTTAAFTPPNGSVMVAIISAASGSGTPSMSVTDSQGLTWTPVSQGTSSNHNGFTGIFWASAPSVAIAAADAGGATATEGQSISAHLNDNDRLTSGDGGESAQQAGPYEPQGDTSSPVTEIAQVSVASADTGSVNASTGEDGSVTIGVTVHVFDYDTTQRISTATPSGHDTGQSLDTERVAVHVTAADTGHGQDGF